MLYIILLIAAEFLVLLFARLNYITKDAVININMLTLTILGGKVFYFLNTPVGVRGVLFPAACFASLLIADKLTEDKVFINATKSLINVFIIIVFTILIGQIHALPEISSNVEISNAVTVVAKASSTLMVAIFSSYFIAQVVLIKSYLHLPIKNNFLRYAAASTLCELASAVLFLPIIFYGNYFKLVVVGLVFRLLVMLLFYPILWLKEKQSDFSVEVG